MTASGPDGPASSAVIEEITALGPFFALHTHPAGSAPTPPWRPMSELVRDPAVPAARVAAVRDWLALAGGQAADAVELRVAASVAHLGLAARLLSPALAAAVLHGRLLAPDLGTLWWQPVLGGPVPLSAPDGPIAERRTPEQLAELLGCRLLDTGLAELAAAFRPFSVSPQILHGNAASAVNGAADMIASARPALADRVRTLAALLLARPPLRAASTTTPTGAFRRRSCCLIYRAAPDTRGPLCGDCVLTR
ncbi:(2Fe-2S)-binding protein [Streptomyces sp. NPDC092296]|uniref:(2Fe-2S)-binding protein n=1 Tax=Streptomyces sp. NPDC092296 TaxID=3366012 RepID=UPI00381B8124